MHIPYLAWEEVEKPDLRPGEKRMQEPYSGYICLRLRPTFESSNPNPKFCISDKMGYTIVFEINNKGQTE
jgi:hypothetical protein